jgi:predicted permease
MLTRITVAIARIRAFVRGADDDREFGRELEAHLALAVDEKVRRGMTPEQARRAARLELGGLPSLREAHRETRGLPLLDTLVQDLRFSLRTFRRDAGFTVFALVIVGLGVGASSTVFSVVNALLLRPLPFRAADRLVWIANIGDDGVQEWKIQAAHYLDLRTQNRSFSELAAYNSYVDAGGVKLTGDGEPERLTSVPVSDNFFSFLGIQPAIGRLFNAEEYQQNGPAAVILSHGFWKRRYASDPAIVGRAITLNDRAVTVAGVLPASFDFSAVFTPGARVDLFQPYPIAHQTGGGNTIAVIGRLKPGVTVDAARAEFTALGLQLTRQFPERNDVRPSLTPLDARINGRFRPALLVLTWAVAAVMLIVCANLSNLQIARMFSRQRELAIRVALGAGRGRLIRQLLTESVLLSCGGAALGLLLALAGTRMVSRLEAFAIPLLDRVRLDAAAFGFTLLVSVLTGLIFGLMPALQVPALSVHTALKESTRGSTDGRHRAWIRGALVVSEVAFACVLLVAAGLLVRSLLRVLDVDLGFRPERTAALRIDPGPQYSDRAKRNAYYDEALRRVRDIGGVRAAALGDLLPLASSRSWGVAGEGQVYARDQYPQAFVRVVSDGYFGTMGIPVRAGRDFTSRDTPATELVVIVNDVLARMLWPGQDPIGQRIGHGGNGVRQVIGVVGAVRHQALEAGFTGEMYLPIRQTNNYPSVDVVVRTDLPPASLAASVRAALEPIAPNLPSQEWRPLQQLVDRAASPRRFVVLLLAGFSGFALILASLGIYGLISYAVNQRTQEIGIRMALGASAREVQGRIILQTLRLAAIGLIIGVAASWIVGRALTGLLFGVTSTDPVTFVGMALLLTAVAAIAGYIPARRASRIDPITALRAG